MQAALAEHAGHGRRAEQPLTPGCHAVPPCPATALQIMPASYKKQRPELIAATRRLGEQLKLPGAGGQAGGRAGCPGLRVLPACCPCTTRIHPQAPNLPIKPTLFVVPACRRDGLRRGASAGPSYECALDPHTQHRPRRRPGRGRGRLPARGGHAPSGAARGAAPGRGDGGAGGGRGAASAGGHADPRDGRAGRRHRLRLRCQGCPGVCAVAPARQGGMLARGHAAAAVSLLPA